MGVSINLYSARTSSMMLTSPHLIAFLAVLSDSSRTFDNPSHHLPALFSAVPAPMDDLRRTLSVDYPLDMTDGRAGIIDSPACVYVSSAIPVEPALSFSPLVVARRSHYTMAVVPLTASSRAVLLRLVVLVAAQNCICSWLAAAQWLLLITFLEIL